MRQSAVAILLSIPLLGLFLGCDKEPTKLEQMASATASATASVPPKPAEPLKPQLAVDESGASVGGDRIDFALPDPKGRLVTSLASPDHKSVAGEEITLDAARDTKLKKVATVFAALSASKAKSVRVRTPKRDRSSAEIVFPLGQKLPDCAAAGFIAKDNGITAWRVSGAEAARFTRGMAGPDLTRGSEGVRKLIASCDASAWAVSSDENVTWGLVLDLVLAVSGAEDGGTPPKARDVVLLTKEPTPGRKVDVE